MPILIEILLYQFLFLVVYQAIKNEPFFQLNRIYLLGSLAASFALPFVEWNWFQFSFHPEIIRNSNYLPEVIVGINSIENTSAVYHQTSIDFISILENLYFLGFSITVSLLYIKIEKIVQLIQENRSASKKYGKLVYLKNGHQAFSFYNYIFIGNEISTSEQLAVIEHEKEHVRLKHSLDLSFLAFTKVLMWFNPFLYWYEKELQLIHEYQADARVCAKLNTKTYAWQLLNTAFKTENMSLMSSFYNKSFIKNRIKMLHQKKNTNRLIKYVLITPILLIAFSFNLIAQSSLPKDEQALLDKYKKEIATLVEQGDMSVYYDYVIDVEKDKNNILTKDAFYRMKAFAILANEKGMRPTKKLDKALLTEDYASYVKRMNKSKKVVLIQSNKTVVEKEYDSDVPFSAVDRVPVYPGCNEDFSNQELRNCMSKNIQEHINKNFDTSIAAKVGLTGQNRVYVRFTISKNGEITDVNARAAHPELSKAGENAVKSLPKMKPGMHNEENVNVIYTLPITFLIPEKEEMDDKQ